MRKYYIAAALGYFFLGVALACMFAGCAEPRDSHKRFETAVPYLAYQVGPYGDRAYEFALVDGTRCVAFEGRAITCEWKQPVILVPRVQ